MTTPRWEKQDDGSYKCEHGSFKPPMSCAKCNADPGPAPAEQPLIITFPDDCKSDEQAWRELTADAKQLAGELVFYRNIRRRLYSKTPKVTDGEEREKSATVLTGEVISQLATIANCIVKLQDARTKTLRAVVETSQAHRRDQRTAQMLSAKLAKLKAKRGAGR